MTNSMKPPFLKLHSRFDSGCRDSDGFMSAQWIVLMMFTVVLLATLVQALLIENVRATTLASLRDSAREGTRVVDLGRVVNTSDEGIAVAACEDRLRTAIKELTNKDIDTTSDRCVVKVNPTTNKPYMEANIGDTFDTIKIVPWAGVFKGRLKGLKGTYVPREAAE